MESHQKVFLLKGWACAVTTLGADRGKREHLDPATTRLIEGGERLVEWLRFGRPPHPELRAFLEEELLTFDQESGYEELAYEHDAMVAAIEAIS
jgi:hypothetical protein